MTLSHAEYCIMVCIALSVAYLPVPSLKKLISGSVIMIPAMWCGYIADALTLTRFVSLISTSIAVAAPLPTQPFCTFDLGLCLKVTQRGEPGCRAWRD